MLLFGDFNAYSVDHQGFSGDSSEFDAHLPDDIVWLVRRKSECSHPRRNRNGRDLIALCQSCELIVVNGAVAGSKQFDSSCTRVSHRIDGGSVIDYFVASPTLFSLVSLICRSYRTTDIVTIMLLRSAGMGSPLRHVRRHGCPYPGCQQRLGCQRRLGRLCPGRQSTNRHGLVSARADGAFWGVSLKTNVMISSPGL